jgi:esterase/lipase superfamily enzyme
MLQRCFMERVLDGWFSQALQKEMPIVRYGNYGFSLLLIPTAAADYLEYERFQLLDALAPMVNAGKCKVYSINSINNESWLNNDMHPPHKAIRHNQFNEYVFKEVIPYIHTWSGWQTPIYTAGASFGALHSMNLFLKRPDIIHGVIAMSGVYNLEEYTKGYYDEQVYFNSPIHYVPNLSDHWYLSKIRESNHIHILTGNGAHEDPAAAGTFAKVLYDKGINYELDMWGDEYSHDWPTWRAMLPHYLSTRF